MAIFGNIGRKITDAGQNVAQQTKDLAEITKLNNQISGLEKKQNEIFLALGRACYEQQKDDASSENRDLLDELMEIDAQVDGINERIKQIKGFEKCPRCGADVASDALFCAACGLKIERAQRSQPRQVFCMNCGAKLTEGARFCIACGTPIENADGLADQEPEPEAAWTEEAGYEPTEETADEERGEF